MYSQNWNYEYYVLYIHGTWIWAFAEFKQLFNVDQVMNLWDSAWMPHTWPTQASFTKQTFGTAMGPCVGHSQSGTCSLHISNSTQVLETLCRRHLYCSPPRPGPCLPSPPQLYQSFHSIYFWTTRKWQTCILGYCDFTPPWWVFLNYSP